MQMVFNNNYFRFPFSEDVLHKTKSKVIVRKKLYGKYPDLEFYHQALCLEKRRYAPVECHLGIHLRRIFRFPKYQMFL